MPSSPSSVTASSGKVPPRDLRHSLIGRGLHKLAFRAMGSPCELLIEAVGDSDAENIGAIVAAEAWRIEDKFSRYLHGNLVDRINRGGRVDVDEETAGLIDFAVTLFGLSDGRFDITSGVLREAWTFDGSDRLPPAQQVEAILARVGWDKVSWRRPTIRLPKGMQIDFGGIAKEYAVDRAAGLVRGATAAAALVNFGGDLAAVGAPAAADGWQVGVDAVNRPGAAVKTRIRLESGALATSGDARRFLLKDGVRYGHILDPTTGWPVRDAPRSITVAADTCTEAGMLATLAMLHGPKARDFLTRERVRFWAFD